MMPTTAQIHGIIRFLMTVSGSVLAAFGYTKLGTDQANQLATLLEAAAGTLLPLASFVWNMYSHSASGLGKHFNQLKET